MRPKLNRLAALALMGFLMVPLGSFAQSDDAEVPLGDLARLARKKKAPVAETVIDNDNISKVMDDVQTHRLKGQPIFSIDTEGKNFRMTSPDGTCSLSFDANATPLISNAYVPESLPQSELLKLDGPASIDGSNFQLSVYNGTKWQVKEITVGLTIVRRQASAAAHYGSARLVPASAESIIPSEKRSDLTLLYHMKGSAAPFTTTVFHETLEVQLDPDQEWHWAIIQASGILPKADNASKPN